MKVAHLDTSSPSLERATTFLRGDFVPLITVIGAPSLLQHDTAALFCSVKCSGISTLKTYDLTYIWIDDESVRPFKNFLSTKQYKMAEPVKRDWAVVNGNMRDENR